MWNYEKKLQFPINIKTPDAKTAKIIMSQYGGPDGEISASRVFDIIENYPKEEYGTEELEKFSGKIELKDVTFSYDKEVNRYSASELCAFAYPNLKLVDTWKFDDFAEGWRYYVFMKV